jgi:hypothetical protein
MNVSALICAATFSFGPSPNPTVVDLDRDGRLDSVRVEFGADKWRYTIFVNDQRVEDHGEVLLGTFGIVDIDTTDAFLEIAIPQEGPSDDYEVHFHYYDGHGIRKVGSVPGTTRMRFNGLGRIYTECRGQILHTWFCPCVFALERDHRLEQLRQSLYQMGTRCTVKRAFPLAVSQTDSTTITVLQPGDKVVILATDDKSWCLVETEDATWGWFKISGYDSVLPPHVRASEVFEGLSYAD